MFLLFRLFEQTRARCFLMFFGINTHKKDVARGDDGTRERKVQVPFFKLINKYIRGCSQHRWWARPLAHAYNFTIRYRDVVEKQEAIWPTGV